MTCKAALTLAVIAGVLAVSSCGDDYTKNQDEDDKPSRNNSTNNSDATGEQNTDGDQKETQSGSTNNGTNNSTTSGNDTTTNNTSSGVTIQDILSGIFGGNNSGDQNNQTGQPGQTGTNTGGTNTPIPPAPEPSDDDCIGADEFICAVEVAITYHTNLLRTGTDLKHHARLSYVARDWSRQQMERGSIGHQGFPASRRTFYNASFPGDSVSIQAENVAYSSGRSGATADDVAKMFVNMWANSAGHRRNMLGNYEIIGVGISKSGSRYYATQIFGAE